MITEQHIKIMMRYAKNMTRHHEDAQDLVQDALVVAWTKLDKYKPDNFLGWLCTIVKNTYFNKLKRDKVKRLNTSYIDTVHTELKPVYQTPLDEERTVNHYLKHLTKEKKVVMEMWMNGYKYDNIADEIGIPVGTVKTRMMRSKEELKKIFGNI